jgi:EpsI family protein
MRLEHRIATLGLLFILTGMVSLFFSHRTDGRPDASHLPLNLPMIFRGWTGTPLSTVLPREVEPGDYLLRTYRQGSDRGIDLLILYSRIANYHPPALCYRGTGRHLTEIPPLASTSGRIRLAGLMGKRGAETILVYHGFYIGGAILPDGVKKKWYEAKEQLLHGVIRQYFFEIAIDATNETNRELTLFYLRAFLDDLEPHLLKTFSS